MEDNIPCYYQYLWTKQNYKIQIHYSKYTIHKKVANEKQKSIQNTNDYTIPYKNELSYIANG